MAFTEEDIKRLIETYLNSNSVVLSGLEKNDTDDDIWVFGTQGSGENKKSVRIKLSDLKGGKGDDGETTQEVSIYRKSDTYPGPPVGIDDGTGLPPEDWLLEQDSEDGVWWVSKGTFVINPDKIYSEDPKIRYGRMIGGWSIPYKITTTDGSTTTTAHRYYSSLSSTDAPKIKRNELEPTTPGWKTEYMLSNNPNMGLEHINDQSKPAEYNQFLGENSVFLWEIEGQILNDEQLIGLWSNPFLKTPPPTGEKPETPILTTVLNIETSSYLMECDPDTFKALPQSITITAKPQNFKDLEVGDVKFTMVPYNVGGNPINSIPLDVDMGDSELPTTIITNSNWGDEYAKVEITCTIKNRRATTTIHRHTNTKYGDSVVFGYLQPPSVNLPSDEDGMIPEEKYLGFRGQFVLIDAGVTIIDSEVGNPDVEFNFKNVTPGLVMAIVENGKWKSNNSEHVINGTDAGEEGEGDGAFKIIDYSRASDFMGVTIVSKYRNIKYPLPFSINKIKEFDPTNPPPQNTDTDESIYTLTKGYRIPEITIKDDYLTSERYIADNFIPDKIKDGDNVTWAPDYITWAGKPLLIDPIFDHLWRSDRVKTNGVWRAFDPPYLWTNYSKPPEIDPNSRLQAFLENGFEFFSGNKGDKAEVFVRSFLDVSPQGISKICVGDSLDVEGNPKIEGTYDEFFDFKIDSTEDKITFTLNRDNDEAKNSFIPINVTVNGKDFGLQFKYVIAPRTELRTIMKLTTTSSVIARDLTDDSSYQKDSTPKFIEVVGHHLNVDNLEWSYRIDGVGEYNSITTSTVGLSVRDNVVTITTPELVVSNTLEIMLKGKTIPDGYETFDVIGITVINHGRTGIPGKMPFTREWKEGDSYRNNLSVVDYVYYRDYTTPGRNGWFRLSDSYLEHVADATPYEDTAGNTTSTVIRKNTDGEDIYVKIDSLGAKAFDLVIAEEANLAGFIFKNNVLQSQDETTIDNIRYPNLILDGVKGKITALDAVIKGEITAIEGYIGDLKVKGGYLEGYKRVKRPGQEDELINTMGLNANNGEGKDNIAFWAGGSLNDIYRYDTKSKDQRTGDESFAYIKHNGRAFFTNADISGKMTATEGTIGGFDIVGDTLVGSYKNEDDDFVQTVGLIANADIHKTNRGVAFWAGTPNGGNLNPNARIMHDGKAFFTGAEISGNITATSGYIGNFKIEGGYLIGHYKDDNDVLVATTGLNANKGDGKDNLAFWAGGSLAEVFDKANHDPIPDNKDSIAYITHDGKAFFNNMEIEGKITATSGKIGSWKIEGGGLTSKDFDGVNRSFIKLEETVRGRFLRINDSSSSMIGIRTDNGTALNIYTQDSLGLGIRVDAQTGSRAIVSNGSHEFVQRQSETWNAPGVLAVVTFKLDGLNDQFPFVSSFEEKWCINSLEPSAVRKLTVKQITHNKFRFTHNLGHMDYAPIGFMGAASDGVVNRFIKNTSYCDVELGGKWTVRIATVTVVLFGRNKSPYA